MCLAPICLARGRLSSRTSVIAIWVAPKAFAEASALRPGQKGDQNLSLLSAVKPSLYVSCDSICISVESLKRQVKKRSKLELDENNLTVFFTR